MANLSLNLELAWKRVKEDEKERVFIKNPIEIELIEKDLPSWLEKINEKIALDLYQPSSAYICDYPKNNYGIRPGSHLSFEDRVVYTALIGKCLPIIYRELSWSQNKIDFAHILSPDLNSIAWLSNPFNGWKKWTVESMSKEREGYAYVAMTDVAAFYENINIEILISDLRNIGADFSATELLKKCLKRWGHGNIKGLPQGHSSSDILSKLYLNSIDQNMQAKGFSYLRYSDDIRIFCKKHIDAKKGIVELTRLMRNRGLNLQAAKTKILPFEEAKYQIDEVTTIIIDAQKGITKELSTAGFGNPYMSFFDAQAIISEEKIPLKTLRNTYQTHVIAKLEKINKSIFHFLLNNLAKNNDRCAVNSCLAILTDYPEETKHILSYFSKVLRLKEIERPLMDFLTSENAVYQYQNYLILKLFEEYKEEPDFETMKIVRSIAFDRSKNPYSRSVARKILSDYGSTADLERIESTYSEAESELEKAEIIYCLKRMEIGRRNSFFSQVRDDGELQKRAVAYIKQNYQPLSRQVEAGKNTPNIKTLITIFEKQKLD